MIGALIPAPYRLAVIVGLGVAAAAGGYWRGSQAEHHRHVAREAAIAARIEAAAARTRAATDAIAGRLATAQQDQRRTFTEIRNVANPIVYRTTAVCLGADLHAAGLLDRARAAADGAAAGEPAGDAGTAAGLPAQP